MAASIIVSGPCMIQVDLGAGYVDLGQTDNDNLPQISENDYTHEIKTVSSGQVAEEVVVQGIEAVITATLVKWDAATLTSLRAVQRGAFNQATIGRMLVANNATFGVKILPLTAGKTAYIFGRCFVQPNGIVTSQFGNVEQRAGITFKAIPNASSLLYTTATT